MPAARHVIRALPVSPENRGGIIAIGDVESPIVRAGIDYWLKVRGDRKFPTREDVSPRAIADLLRHVVLVKVIDGGTDYEYRIVGDAHVVAHGFCMQGKKLSQMDEHAPGYGPVLKDLYDNPVRRRGPLAIRGWLSKGEEAFEFVYSESVFLPLGPNDDTVDHVINFAVYVPQPARVLA